MSQFNAPVRRGGGVDVYTGLLFVALLPVVLVAGAVVWKFAGWPPPGLVVRYGIPLSQGPTGRTTELGGIEFVG